MVKPDMSFGETWRAIVDHVRQSAADGSWDPQPNVIAGDFQTDTVDAPAVIVYMAPGKKFDVQNIYSRVATCTLFVCVSGSEYDDITKAVDPAIALGWSIAAAMDAMPITVRWGREKVELDDVKSDYVTVSVTCEVWYA